MVDTLLGYPDENQSPELRRRLYVLFKSLEGRTHNSPRNLLTRIQSRPYLISHLDTESKALVIRQYNKHNTYLHYWRFLHVVDMLNNSKGNPIRIESSNFPKHEDTIEGSLMKRVQEAPYVHQRLRTASFICDILALGGFCKYLSMVNPQTSRPVVWIRKL